MSALTSKQTAAASRIEGLSLPGGGAWAQAARQDALSRLGTMGLPAKRDEYWKFTDPSSLTVADTPEASVFDHGAEELFSAH